GEKVGSQQKIALGRRTARDICDVRIKPAVLMNDNDRRPLSLGLGANEVAIDLAFGRIVRDAFSNKPGIVCGYDGSLRVIVLQQHDERRCGGSRARQYGELIEKLAPRHAAMREAVIEIDDFLIHGLSPSAWCAPRVRCLPYHSMTTSERGAAFAAPLGKFAKRQYADQ